MKRLIEDDPQVFNGRAACFDFRLIDKEKREVLVAISAEDDCLSLVLINLHTVILAS